MNTLRSFLSWLIIKPLFILLIAVLAYGCAASGTANFTIQKTPVQQPEISGQAPGTVIDSVNHYVPQNPSAGVTSTGEVVNAPTPPDTMKDTGSKVTVTTKPSLAPPAMTFVKKSFALWGADAVSPQGDSTHVTFNEFDHSFAWNFHGHTLSIAQPKETVANGTGTWTLVAIVIVVFIVGIGIGVVGGKMISVSV